VHVKQKKTPLKNCFDWIKISDLFFRKRNKFRPLKTYKAFTLLQKLSLNCWYHENKEESI
jgi:hypothetical protein